MGRRGGSEPMVSMNGEYDPSVLSALPPPAASRGHGRRSGGERGVLGGDRLAGGRRERRGAGAERGAAECLPAVRGQPAGQVGARRHDTGRVYVPVDLVVMALDVVEVDGVPE